MSNFDAIIHEMTIPSQLKEYLTNSKSAQNIISEEMLHDIEDLFILYSSLYFFDTTDFSMNTILTLKRTPRPDPIYHYLKKVIDNNVFLISKGDEDNYTLLENQVIDDVLKKSLNDFSNLIKRGDENEKLDMLNVAKGLGKLEILNQIINNEMCESLYSAGECLINQYKDESKENLNR